MGPHSVETIFQKRIELFLRRDGMQMLLCCFYVRVEKEACGNNGSFFSLAE